MLKGIELRSGIKGVFKVYVDGAVEFDKATAGRFPDAGELTTAIRRRIGPPITWRKPEHS